MTRLSLVLLTFFTLGLFFVPEISSADLILSHADPAWIGDKVPKKGICKRQDGGGISPLIKVSAIPPGTVKLLLNFTDEDFGEEGGHGGFEVNISGESEITVPSIQGSAVLTNDKGVQENHSYDGNYYLGPCSDGRGNSYTAYVYAKNTNGDKISKGKLRFGEY